MRRIALTMVVVLAGVLVGCQDPEKTAEPVQAAEVDYGTLPPDMYVTGTPVETTEPSPTYTDYDPPEEAPQPAWSSAATHSVAKGDTLYKLARHYYSDQARWKDIYQANRDQLSDPNKLRVGQDLVIP